MLSPLRLCSRNATTKTQPEDRARRGARRGHGTAAESGPNVSGRGAAASGRAKQGASWDAARPGGDAETMLETTTEDRERDCSSADEAVAGLGRTDSNSEGSSAAGKMPPGSTGRGRETVTDEPLVLRTCTAAPASSAQHPDGLAAPPRPSSSGRTDSPKAQMAVSTF